MEKQLAPHMSTSDSPEQTAISRRMAHQSHHDLPFTHEETSPERKRNLAEVTQ